jgi:phosphoesterase RecJ-like protein
MSRDLARAVALLRGGARFLVTSHVNPDGDSIASQCALRIVLERLGKRVTVFNRQPPPRVYRFLPGADLITQTAPRSLRGFDALVVLDCGDPRRASGLLERTPPIPVVNIDHHVTNPRFGDVNWVDPGASSTAELVFRVAEKLGVRPDGPLAEALYAGILTDTGSFRYGNATARAFLVAGRLVRNGLDPSGIARRIYDAAEYDTLRVLGTTLNGLRRSADRRVAWITIPRRTLARLASPAETEEWVNYPRSVSTAEVAVCFKETAPGEIRVSLRSKSDVDVAALAARWGGGGHRNAAGATYRGTLAHAVRDVVAAAEAALPAGPGARSLPPAATPGRRRPGSSPRR